MDFFTSIEPFLKFAKFLGFSPFAIDKKTWKVFIRKKDVLVTALPISFTIFVHISILVHYYYYNRLYGFFDYKIWVYLMIFSIFLIIILHFKQFKKREKLESFFMITRRIDLLLGVLGEKIDYQKHKKVLKMLLIISSIYSVGAFLSLSSTLFYIRQNIDVIILEFYCFMNFSYELFFCLEFICPTYLIRQRFKLLKICEQTKGGGKSTNLKLTTELFHSLSDAVEKINELFTSHIISIMTTSLLTDIFVSYQIFYYLTQNQLEDSELLLIENGFFIASHLIMKSAVAHVGYTTTREAESFKIAFAKNMDDAWGEKKLDYVYSLTQFSTRNLSLRNVLFVIDWRVMLTVS